MRKNKLVYFIFGTKVKVILKDGFETTWYESKTDAVKGILKLFKENKIEGEEYIKWLGLIFGSSKLSMGELLSEEFAEKGRELALIFLHSLKISFFAMCWSGQNIGYIQLKGGQALSFLVTSKNQGRGVVQSLSHEKRINSDEVKKLLDEINESPLDEISRDDPQEDNFHTICNN